MAVPAILKKQIAGLPAGVWLAVIVAGVGVGLYLRNRQANADAAASDPEAAGTNDTTLMASDQLGNDPYGPYSLTGGGYAGPPVAGGDQAIRLIGPKKPIRIIIRQTGPKKKPHKKPVVHHKPPRKSVKGGRNHPRSYHYRWS